MSAKHLQSECVHTHGEFWETPVGRTIVKQIVHVYPRAESETLCSSQCECTSAAQPATDARHESAAKMRSEMFVRSSEIFVWGA
jgi:hypothetical protein